MKKIFVINPGSTSTKVALYNGSKAVFRETINHSPQEIDKFDTALDQREYRENCIDAILKKHNIELKNVDAIVSRGAPIAPVKGGTYLINEKLIWDITHPTLIHVSLVGPLLAYEMGKKYLKPSFIVDPVSVDELDDISRISGLKELPRKSVTHALNMKAVAKKYSREMGLKYENITLITAHLGGGATAALHHKGKMVDTIDSNGEGPFTPERSGCLRVDDFARLCYSGQLSLEQMIKKITRQAGCYSHLGTFDMIEVEKRVFEGDKKADFITKAMCYTMAKHIAGLTVFCKGNLEAIILTGGLMKNKIVLKYISEYLNYIAKIIVYPGEFELEALRDGVLSVLDGEQKALSYPEGKEIDLC